MGIKAFKKHFEINHIVQMTDKGLCIGSPYVHDIIVVGLDGSIAHRASIGLSCDTLNRYVARIEADQEKARQLIAQPDEFGHLVTIWTYDGAEIIEKKCEIPEWPNCTTDGRMIYANTHSTDRDKVVQWAKRNAEAWRELAQDQVQTREDALRDAKERLAMALDLCEKLGVA